MTDATITYTDCRTLPIRFRVLAHLAGHTGCEQTEAASRCVV
jgi:hypothetical protein